MRVRPLTSSLLIGGAVAFAALPALAQQKGHGHEHGKGPGQVDHAQKHAHPTVQYGGVLEDVGEFHVELVAKDGKITLFLRDHSAKDAASEGFKATVLLTAGSQRVGPVELKPTSSNKMEGPVPAVPAGATAILTLTDKAGTAAQGRFKLK